MFDSYQKSTGTQYTGTIACLLMALIVSPAGLLASRTSGYLPVVASIVFSVIFGGLAWTQWKWNSKLTIPSLTEKSARQA